MSDVAWRDAAAVEDVPPGRVKGIQIEGQALALVNLEGELHAVSAVCPHRGGPLGEGSLYHGHLQCPWHNFLFDVRTGENVFPANVYPEDLPELREQLRPLTVYSVRVKRGRILVRL